MPHSTSGLFSQSTWQGGIGGTPCNNRILSSPTHLTARPRHFEFNPIDSVELPHNFIASPQEHPAENGALPLGDSLGTPKANHHMSDKDFSYSSFHLEADLTVAPELKTELEIEETVLNEGVAMNYSTQIVVGEESQEEFWDPGEKTSKMSGPRLTCSVDPCGQDWDNSSSDEDMENYFDFTRTVVTRKAPRDASQTPTSPSLRQISQLDGIDDGTESDTSIANSDAQSLKKPNQAQKPHKSFHSEPHEQAASNGLFTSAVSKISSNNCGLETVSNSVDTPSSEAVIDLNSFPVPQPLQTNSLLVLPSQDNLTTFVDLKSSNTTFSAYSKDDQDSSLVFETETPLILETCDPPSPSACFTELLPVQEDSSVDPQVFTGLKEIFLDPSSGHFVSSMNASSLYPHQLPEGVLTLCPVNGIQTPMQQSTELPKSTTSVEPLSSLYPVQTPEGKMVLPPMESFRTKLNPPTDSRQPAPSVPGGAMPCVPISSLQKPESMLSVPSATGVPLGTQGPVSGTLSVPLYPAYSQPIGSTTVGVVSSSPSVTSQPSDECQPMPSDTQPASAPGVSNGYNTMPMQKETSPARTISINFSTPRSSIEPQQQLVTQALPGHAILTVKEVGGPNVDPTPHVLLVNRLGQIFVKNPESNTFQLPTPNSPSFSCVTQIASLLQSNALSATLAAAGNLQSATGSAISNQVPQIVTPLVQTSNTITQLLTTNSNETTTLPADVKMPRRNAKASGAGSTAGPKKPRIKKESSTPRRTKSGPSSKQSAGQLTKSSDAYQAESAQAIINQAMAGYYDPNKTVSHVLSSPSPQSISSAVLPQELLVEPETVASPPSPPDAAPRPKQVRMKRVSSLSDRIAIKKSKADFLESDCPSGLEEVRKAGSVSAR